MSLLEKASLIITPNATKAGKLYSVVPNTPLGDMDVVRATTATRVNSLGLIETVGLNVPRLDYSNGSCPSLLVEGQRTNLATYSERFDNASWDKLNGSVTQNNNISPKGIQDADTFIPSAISGSHALRSNFFNTTTTTSHSFFVKANGYTKVSVRESQIGGNYASFDLSNGTLLDTNQSGYIENYGNGWYRCTLIDTLFGTSARSGLFVLPASYTSGNPTVAWTPNGTDSVIVWGAQVEQGSNATSYIPTVDTTVTRNADVISKTGISSLIGQTEGTMFVDVDYKYNNINQSLFYLNSDAQNNINLLVLADYTIRLAVVVLGTLVVNITNKPNEGRLKIAASYKQNEFILYFNGIKIGTDLLGNIPFMDKLLLNDVKNGNINSAQLYKTTLTDQELISLTTL